MKKFEYRVVNITLEQMQEAGHKDGQAWYNYMGHAGWEMIVKEGPLFNSSYYCYIFKREVIDQPEPGETYNALEKFSYEEMQQELNRRYSNKKPTPKLK